MGTGSFGVQQVNGFRNPSYIVDTPNETNLMKTLLILLILAIANHSSSAIEIISKDSATPIVSVPYTISSPGIYYLANNILSTLNAKITITASNVVLDLGGHKLQVSSIDDCVSVDGSGSSPATNVTIQNGALVNKVAQCIFLAFGTGCVIDHVSATSAGQCTLYDTLGSGNRISNCVFTSGTLQNGPMAHYGPAPATVYLAGTGDLLDNNIITSVAGHSAIISGITGTSPSTAGNVVRNNIVYSPTPANPPFNPPVALDSYDVYIGNLFPGKPVGATNIIGGIHATD